MSGFRPGENFAIEPGAIDRFEPLDLARQGFFVSQNGIAINSHHPRFGDEGEAMFDDDGQPARLVRHIQRVLGQLRSEEHTSELQSLMRISYAVFCLKKKKKKQIDGWSSTDET